MNGLKFAIAKEFIGKVTPPKRVGSIEAGIDFFIPDNFSPVALYQGDSILIDLGIRIKLPEVPESLRGTHEYFLKFDNKSGIAYKNGLVVGSCIIDASYQGNLFLNLHKNAHSVHKPGGVFRSIDATRLEPGLSIVQGIVTLCNIEPVTEVAEEDLYTEVTQRGDKGFGSNYEEVKPIV